MAARRGFTFIEIALATMLTALAIIPCMSLLQRDVRGTAMNRDRVFAAHLANNVIERLRMEPLRALELALDDPVDASFLIAQSPLLNRAPTPACATMLSRFQRRAWLTLDPATGGRKGVLRVRVTWLEDVHEREYETSIVLVDADFPAGRP